MITKQLRRPTPTQEIDAAVKACARNHMLIKDIVLWTVVTYMLITDDNDKDAPNARRLIEFISGWGESCDCAE